MFVDEELRMFIEEVAEEIARASYPEGAPPRKEGRKIVGGKGNQNNKNIYRTRYNGDAEDNDGLTGGDHAANKRRQAERTSASHDETDDAVEGREAAESAKAQSIFFSGVKTLSLPAVQRGLEDGANPNLGEEGSGCPLFVLASTKIASDFPQVRAIALRLLMEPTIEPNGDGHSWTPLKTAVSSKNQNLAIDLMSHQRTITEVEISGLDCSVLEMDLPATLKWYISGSKMTVASTPKCFRDLPPHRKVGDEESLLAKFSRDRTWAKGLRTTANVKGGTAGGSPSKANTKGFAKAKKGADIDPRNPFIVLPQGVYPPRDTAMMNPTPFSNIVSASAYYFLGPLPEPLAMLGLLTCLTLALALGTMIIHTVTVTERNRIAIEKDAELARLREKEAAMAKSTAEREQRERETAQERLQQEAPRAEDPPAEEAVGALSARPAAVATAGPPAGDPPFDFADEDEIAAHDDARARRM